MAKIDWDGFDLEVIFEGKTTDLKKKYQEEVRFAKETIDDDLRDQPSLFAFYAVMSELAEEAYEDAKLELELVEATLDDHYRKELIRTGEKSTDKKVEAIIKADKRRVKSIKNLITAKKNRGILRALTRAFEQRKESLIAFSSNFRQERDVDIFIKKEEIKQKFKKE